MGKRKRTLAEGSTTREEGASDTLMVKRASTSPQRRSKTKAQRSLKKEKAHRSDREEQEVLRAPKTPKRKTSTKARNTTKRAKTEEDNADFDRSDTFKLADQPRTHKKRNSSEVVGMSTVQHFASTMRVGAHVSIAGGFHEAVKRSVKIGGTAIGLFTGSQRQWKSKPLVASDVQKWKQAVEKSGYSLDNVVPHGTYLVNLGSPNDEMREKGKEKFVDELSRCNQLGITMLNIHPGSTKGEISVEECCKRIADGINWAHSQEATGSVKLTLSDLSSGTFISVYRSHCNKSPNLNDEDSDLQEYYVHRGGNTIGRTFEELKLIIDSIDDKSRVGVCLDTCHLFASGYDIRDQDAYNETMKKFSEIVGLDYLSAFHLNDSKADLATNKDRHENIGKGFIGENAFKCIMRDNRLAGIPMILETPAKGNEEEVYGKEIAMLYGFEKQ